LEHQLEQSETKWIELSQKYEKTNAELSDLKVISNFFSFRNCSNKLGYDFFLE